MSRQCEVAISGTCSSFKTRTGRDIVGELEDACLFSRGSVFRSAAEVLGKYGIPPHMVTSPVLERILRQFISSDVVNDIVTFDYRDGSVFEHTHKNGVLATNYAENPVVQTVLAKYIKDKTKELHKDYSTVIYEGRSLLDNGLNIYLTAPTAIRTEIKKIECDVSGLSDEEIKKGIIYRDLKDTYKSVEPLKRPSAGFIIRRESLSNNEHQAIVEFGIDAIERFRESRMSFPKHEILYTYDPEIGSLRERVPSYR